MENNKYSDEEIERCTLKGPREIIQQIRGLIKNCNKLSVIFQGGQQTFLTILLDISPNNDLFYFDLSGSPEINQAFLNAGNGFFNTFVEGICIRFPVQDVQKATLNGEPAFVAPIPEYLIRLQRREMFRLQLPTVKPFTCRLCRNAPEEETQPLRDISVGGVGILFQHSTQYSQLDKLENCGLDLRGVGIISCTLEVRHVDRIQNASGKLLWHVGCQFIELPSPDEMLIQRFMAKIEAERRG